MRLHLFVPFLLPVLGTALLLQALKEIPRALLTKFTLFSQYSAASTCRGNHNSTSVGSPVYCGVESCPLISAADTEILFGFSNIDPGDTAGYLAADHTNGLLIISFRHTMTMANVITDWTISQVDASAACSGCLAHKGYWSAAVAVGQVLKRPIRHAKARYPDYGLAVTGHSLGGALATLYAVSLRNEGYNADFYTFGAPSIGNYVFAEFITNMSDSDRGRNYRITHLNDEVPKVLYRTSRAPALNLVVAEYSQSGPEYWITSAFEEPVTTADIQVLEGVNNEGGNLGRELGSLRDHLWYFGPTSFCLMP
ncbi:lipase family protein [Aspergillus mulundensis]|uniref:feruloyl esterase n=1 Tax=Aspergillus mulundensis TaxID=1810919 RepID=A0A3D8SJ16_9EURO|nr:Uncharacterized protein DSM5745_02904 [Aspergillus mulundensis]RDW86262.1 Uncharacterized protein DSM5745_02904 [Aspergillus mulundensis]